MKTIRNIALASSTFASLIAITPVPAHACGGFFHQCGGGFIANLAKPIIGEPARKLLDDTHAALGKPLDNPKVQGAIIGAIVPGSGPAVAAALEARRVFEARARAYREQARQIQDIKSIPQAVVPQASVEKPIFTPPYFAKTAKTRIEDSTSNDLNDADDFDDGDDE